MVILCAFLAIACIYDYRDRRIPNWLIGVMAVQGAVWRFLDRGMWGVCLWLGGMVTIVVLLYPLFKIGSLGAGDVKLFGVTAGFLPFEKILLFLFFSLLIAAVISLIKMWKDKSFGHRMRYLSGYLVSVVKSGRWRLYSRKGEGKETGICLAGPAFFSILLYLGGVY